MKLDPTVIRTMNRQDFRVLAAVETGMKTHELVPAPLIASIAHLRHGGTNKVLSSLLRDKLLSHDCSCGYDGYRVTNSGYDILALHNLKSRGFVAALGDKIGTGKESDVYLAATPTGKQVVLKFHRLGRTSFRNVKKKRDYFNAAVLSKNKKRGIASPKHEPNSWLFLSRISALKEFAFMKALHQVEYPTPTPIAHNRHVVCMSLVRGMPLYQLHTNRVSAQQAQSIFEQSTRLATRLAQHGLVHCDLNEFNLMVDLAGIQQVLAGDNDVSEHYVRHSGQSVASSKGALSAAHGPLQKQRVDATGEVVTELPPEPLELLANGEPKPIVTLIDFPQMVSTRHPNAQELYQRDMNCLKRFFTMKLQCLPDQEWDKLIPSWQDLVKPVDNDIADNDDESTCIASQAQLRLDQELQASGFSQDDAQRDAELYYYQSKTRAALETVQDDDSDSEEEQGSNVDGDQAYHDQDQDELAQHNVSDIHDDDDDGGSISSSGSDLQPSIAASRILNDDELSIVTQQSRAMAVEKAKLRVQQHLDARKKKKGRNQAFKSKNSNKTFVKGKRVFNDVHGSYDE